MSAARTDTALPPVLGRNPAAGRGLASGTAATTAFGHGDDGLAGTDRAPDVPVERLAVSAYTVPTDRPESDGTKAWESTTLVLVEATAGGETGIGYAYAHAAAAHVAADLLAHTVAGRDALDVGAAGATSGRPTARPTSWAAAAWAPTPPRASPTPTGGRGTSPTSGSATARSSRRAAA